MLRRAAEHGHEALEIETFLRGNLLLDALHILEGDNAKNYRRLVESYGLTISTIGNHPECQMVLGPYGKDTDDFFEGTKEEKIRYGTEAAIRAAQIANALEVPTVVGFAGCENFGRVCQWPDSRAWEREEAVFVERWLPILDRYREYGVRFAHEPHPNQIVYDIETAQRSLDLLDRHPAWGFNFDPANMMFLGIEVEGFLDAFPDRIFSVHAKDVQIVRQNVRRSGLMPQGNYRRLDRGVRFRIPGWGNVNWRDVITELSMINYQGALNFEHEDIIMSREDGITKTAEYLKPLLIHGPFEGRNDLNFRF